MIIGLSLLLLFFSYIAYRRRDIAPSATPAPPRLPNSPTSRSLRIPYRSTPPSTPTSYSFDPLFHLRRRTPDSTMWPFLSSFASGSSSTSSSNSAPIVRHHIPVEVVSPPPSPPTFTFLDDGDKTPRAGSPAQSAVPSIQLDDEDFDNMPPPSFPATNSAQRASGGLAGMGMMPPPARPPIQIQGRNPRARPVPMAALKVPGQGASGVAASNGLTLRKNLNSAAAARQKPARSATAEERGGKNSRKVVLEPGHSPLDWARLQRSGVDLRGLPHPHLLKVPPSLLAQHGRGADQVWMALDGKVYNVSAYMPFHPGGDKELLRAAGKDGTKMFAATHPWVNVEGMLGECLIGILVGEEEGTRWMEKMEGALGGGSAGMGVELGGEWESVD